MNRSLRSGSKTAVAVSVAVLLLFAGAASGRTAGPTHAAGDPSTDKLAQILARGTLILSTDPAYPPQSYLVKGAKRLAHTKCAANQMTANQMAGYDADTGKLVAERLGVEPCFVTPTWSEIISGHWNDQWDISYGSGAINSDRASRLYFTQPYYAAPQMFFVAAGSKFEKPADLNGKTIGVCAGCTHELYLKRTLTIPGVKVVFKVKNVKIAIFDVENPGLQAVADGKLAAFLCAAPEGDGAIHNGLKLRAIKEPAFFMYPTGFVDRYSAYDVKAFVAKVNSTVQGLHADGSLKRLSRKDFFGADYATKAGEFNLAVIHQVVR
jgi:polar amino acid transport system substrate-binding protein